MAGTVDPLALPDLSPEALALLIQQQNAQLAAEGEKARAGAKWSQPNLLPLSLGRDETGQVIGAKPAMPQALLDILGALTLPGDVYQGNVDPMGAEGLQRAAEFPLAISMPGMGTQAISGQALDPNLLNIFAGPRSKTADLDKLEVAREMAQQVGKETGKVPLSSVEDIFSQTGWFPGPDGKWKYEIPDYPVGKDLSFQEGTKPERGLVGDFISHPELFAAYPDLETMRLKAGYGPRQAGVNYQTDQGIEAFGPGEGDIISVILHELQHGVQTKEGFGAGGNPEQTKNFLANIAPTADQQLQFPDPYMIYRALMGETEARAVQSRYDFGTALTPTPSTSLLPDSQVPQGWGFAEGKGTGEQFQTSPYYREPGVDPDITGSYDIPFNLQINPNQLRAAQKDGPGSSNSIPLLQQLQALKIALAGSK